MEPLNQYFDIHFREHFISCHQICICHNQYVPVCHFNVHIVPVWIAIILVSAFFSFFFFLVQSAIVDFVNCEQCIRALFTVPQITLFSNVFIINGSHSTIYTFKNYFATVFSVSATISSIQTDPQAQCFLGEGNNTIF